MWSDPDGSRVSDDPVELGVELLAHLEYEEVGLPEVVDRLEAISGDPAIVREILDTADRRGVIERDGALIRPTGGEFVRFESEVVTKEGEFTCKRCGADISTGHFIVFEAGEHGPFGSTCIRRVTGRED